MMSWSARGTAVYAAQELQPPPGHPSLEPHDVSGHIGPLELMNGWLAVGTFAGVVVTNKCRAVFRCWFNPDSL